MEGAHDGALRGYCNVREQVLHPSPPPFLPHTSPSSPPCHTPSALMAP